MERNDLIAKKDFYNKNKNILSKEICEKIDKAFDVDFTYHSTTIEGNTLSLVETKLVLDDEISVGGKKLREIYETINHNKAFDFVKDSISKGKDLDEDLVKDLHQILMENIMQGGIYRDTNVKIIGTNHTPPEPNDMYNEIKIFYQDLKDNSCKMDPIKLASWTHAEFVRIHPFADGNGRTARLIMNYVLMEYNYLPIIIKVDDREKYYNYLDEYTVDGKLNDFEDFIENLESKRLDEVNKIIEQSM